MSEANTVTVQIEDAVAIVTLNRPAKRNAMSPDPASRNGGGSGEAAL